MAGSQMSMKRIKKEILDLPKEDMGEIQLAPLEKSMYEWQATIPGPAGSPYAGGKFQLVIHLPKDYPFSAPKVVFTTPIYHPNVSPQGHICIDILKTAWSPALSLFKVMLSLSSLLTDPNPKDPLVPEIAKQYLQNRALFDKHARELTAKHAMGNDKSSGSKPSVSSSAGRATRPVQTSSSASSSGLLAGLVNFATGLRGAGPPPQPVIAIGTPLAAPRTLRNTARSATSTSTASTAPVTAPTRIQRAQNDVTIEVIDLDDESSPPTSRARAGTKRRRSDEDTGASADTRDSTRRRLNPSAPSSGADEVIVIDDD